jgi:hypothetical protein
MILLAKKPVSKCKLSQTRTMKVISPAFIRETKKTVMPGMTVFFTKY